MSSNALVLAAHGSRHEPGVNAQIRALADDVAARDRFDEVAVAFHQGDPPFATVLDTLSADEIVVVPVMTSEGYYTEQVVPRELARSRRLTQPAPPALRITRPVGTHPALVDLVAHRLVTLQRRYSLDPAGTSVAVVGHGTQRHPRSRNATAELATRLGQRGPSDDVFAAFLDEAPFVESIAELARHPAVMVVLFLIGAGPHATRDVPARIGIDVPDGAALSVAGRVGRRTIVCDAPIGTDAGLADIILDLASPLRSAPRQAETGADGGSQVRSAAAGQTGGAASDGHDRPATAAGPPDPKAAHTRPAVAGTDAPEASR